jgi:hypothetical protein
METRKLSALCALGGKFVMTVGSRVNPCPKKGDRKGFRLAVNLATQINTIKN